MRHYNTLFCAGLLVLLCFGTDARAEEIGLEQFQKLHEELQTSEKEPWRQIPWNVSLLDAQNLAAKSQKPIFIWAMDGHPLGCT